MTLWQNDVLSLPTCLWQTYRDILQSTGLLDACVEGLEKKAIHGGATAAEAQEHFTYRFPTSAARLCFLTLDPKGSLRNYSNDLKISFATDSLVVVDLAGGTGAAIIGITSTIAKLRELGLLAKLPLTVKVFAADISPDALDVYKQMISAFVPFGEAQGVSVELKTFQWDASNPALTSKLFDACTAAAAQCELFVIVSNLSGVGKTAIDTFERSFAHVTERISNMDSTFIWVEHPGNSATTFLQHVWNMCFGWLFPGTKAEIAADNFEFRHEIQKGGCTLKGGIQIFQYKRNSGE